MKIKQILIFAFIAFCSITSSAQKSLDIKIDIDNYYSDSLIVGYYFADRQLVHDTLIKESKKSFHWKQDTLVAPGMYILVTVPDKQFVQILLPEKDQQFKIKLDGVDLSKMSFDGSDENELFLDYASFLKSQNRSAESIETDIEKNKTEDKDTKKLEQKLSEIDAEVASHIQNLISKHPNSITSLIIGANQRIDFPEFSGTPEEQQMSRYLFYKEHYFDYIDFKHPATLQTPFLDQRVNYYLDKLTPQAPDSLIMSVDRILSKFEPNSKGYKFYLSTFLNTYANSKIVGFDKIYVHLADNYYSSQLSPWVNEETLYKIQDNSRALKPVLLGEIAADLKLFDSQGKSFLISDLSYEYLVVIFWAPDCGHCTKSMPAYVQFEKDFRDKGVKVLAICSKLKDKASTCWEALEEKEMTNFINASDPDHKSRFKIKYNVKTTPKVFVLGKDREILMKNIGAEKLGEVMGNIIEVDRFNKANPDEK